MDRILILLSSYNGENQIERQLESIYRQSYIANIDILVRDDGSKDNTVKILEKYSDKYDNFNFIAGENIGYNKSFFKLIELADNHKYYAFSDQDDVWMEEKIETAYTMLENETRDMALLYGSCSLTSDENLKPLGETQKQYKRVCLRNVMFQNFLPGHTQVFNQKLLDILKQPIDIKKVHVYDHWISLCAVTVGKIIFDNTPHTYYIQHESNSYGYGDSIHEWIKIRMNRLKNHDCESFTMQNENFYDSFKDVMKKEDRDVLEAFISSKTLLKRFQFILKFKPYRQRKLETFLLYILIIIDAYCLKNRGKELY